MNTQPLINIERRFRPEIEGLRFVAALLVAIYHIWFNRVSGGVDVFFVISGFLITSSIISTVNKTGEFRFIPYITNLMKRLLPSIFFILSTVLVLSYFFLPKSILGKTLKEVFASIFFYQNWQLAISKTDYLDSTQMKTPVEHFWALAIQGQFYILWFILFTVILIIIKKYKIVNTKGLINTFLGIIFISSLIYSIYLTSANQQWAYFTTFTRVWQFSLGSLLCINLASIRVNKLFAVIAGWVGLIGLILTGVIFEVSENFPGYIALWPMICAIFIVLSGTRETTYGVKNLLGSRFMVNIGGISFGIYLWHWVLLSFYKYNVQDIPGFFMGVLIILVSIGLSYIMTRFIEEPIRFATSNKFSFRRLGILAGINLALIGLLFLGMPKGQIANGDLLNAEVNPDYPGVMAYFDEYDVPEKEPIPDLAIIKDDLPQSTIDGHNQGEKESDVKVGEYGKTEDYDATIALVGGSTTEHWLGGLLEGTKNHNFRVLSITRSITRFSTLYEDDELQGIWNKNVLEYLKDADVDLVISQATSSRAGANEPYQHTAQMDQLQHVKDEFGIDVLAIRDVPRTGFNIPESLEMNGVEETSRKMNELYEQTDEDAWNEFVETNSSQYKLDLSKYFKVDGKVEPIIGNVVVYRDSAHLTNTISKTFGPMFEEKILEILSEAEDSK